MNGRWLIILAEQAGIPSAKNLTVIYLVAICGELSPKNMRKDKGTISLLLSLVSKKVNTNGSIRPSDINHLSEILTFPDTTFIIRALLVRFVSAKEAHRDHCDSVDS